MQKDRTTIIIAHRLSTIQDVNEILVFKDGSIVERGTHTELFSKKSYYYEMVIAQNINSLGIFGFALLPFSSDDSKIRFIFIYIKIFYILDLHGTEIAKMSEKDGDSDIPSSEIVETRKLTSSSSKSLPYSPFSLQSSSMQMKRLQKAVNVTLSLELFWKN